MLQQSLSTISGVLGFAERLELPSKSTTTNGPILSSLPEASWRSNELFMTGNDVFELGYDQQQTAFPTAGIDRISSPEMGVMNLVQNKSGPMSPQMFRFQENDSESRGGSCSLLMRKIDVDAFLPDESTQDSIVIRWSSVLLVLVLILGDAKSHIQVLYVVFKFRQFSASFVVIAED